MMYATLLLGAVLVSEATAACSRSMLADTAAAYVAAAAAGKPMLLALASNASYAENDTPMDSSKGVLSQAVSVDYNRSLLDTTLCAAAVELTSASGQHPSVIVAHLLLADDKIATVETVVTDAGDWAFNAAGSLRWTKQEKWDAIPEAKRDSRDVIKAAGDAYLDSWGDSTVKPPYGAPCARLEGGSYTGSATGTTNTCTMPQFPQPFKVANRRYVVDEELGGVSILNNFPFIDKAKPDGTPSSNFIRVEGGKIRYIHEATVCAEKNCGR